MKASASERKPVLSLATAVGPTAAPGKASPGTSSQLAGSAAAGGKPSHAKATPAEHGSSTGSSASSSASSSSSTLARSGPPPSTPLPAPIRSPTLASTLTVASPWNTEHARALLVGQRTSVAVGRRVWYFFDDEYACHSFGRGHPIQPFRARLTHQLLVQYSLLREFILCGSYNRAAFADLTRFHTDDYVSSIALAAAAAMADSTGSMASLRRSRDVANVCAAFGIVPDGDCPPFDGMDTFCSIYAGGSLAGARALNAGEADVAINWLGGFPHANPANASGGSFINDVVLAILELLRKHQRVLFINLDSFHADAVESAFYTTDRVLTMSFHRYCDPSVSPAPTFSADIVNSATPKPGTAGARAGATRAGGAGHGRKAAAGGGSTAASTTPATLSSVNAAGASAIAAAVLHNTAFGPIFPGTGAPGDTGAPGPGRGHAINIPLWDGIDDSYAARLFTESVRRTVDAYQPSAIVFRCSTGALAGDRFGTFGLTLQGYSRILDTVLDFGLPVLLLGGGMASSAAGVKMQVCLSARAAGRPLQIGSALPLVAAGREYFAPDFRMYIEPLIGGHAAIAGALAGASAAAPSISQSSNIVSSIGGLEMAEITSRLSLLDAQLSIVRATRLAQDAPLGQNGARMRDALVCSPPPGGDTPAVSPGSRPTAGDREPAPRGAAGRKRHKADCAARLSGAALAPGVSFYL
ncbi:hypothetical protein H696_05179 [Fonticula alba]|uniref:histone deacetylase n=1 Tax=Fonticula alba TaxID=691883 RepID=A0A058Z290_FONAL|nr:hypothetical protein H696_05179 [Fonticula alba]KCV68256.1 hypothetical protein H696_05179 [Fonticula alba]|eukprot:XP_009497310.1 hypothetical protein H696_05179 [Fonticula alba]